MTEVRNSGFLQVIPLLVTFSVLSFPVYAKYGGGTGEPNDPYLIYTAEQMNEIGLNKGDWGKHFKLMADIDLSEYSGDEFNIIGECFYESFWIIRPFTGIFDGNGKKISNFSYASTDTDHIGLFGYVGMWGKEAVIKDLGLIDPNVDAGTGDYIGSLVGELNNGTITGCYVEGGNIVGNGNVGGLVGAYGEAVVWGYPEPPFTISNCFSTSSVQGTRRVGGLVGTNYIGRIINSYATGNVSGNQSVGGLVGQNGKWGEYINFPPIPGAILNCYSTGLVSGQSDVGGLVGLHVAGTVIGCFWDIETSGQAESASGEGKTTAEMQMADTFLSAGWDFVDETDNGTEDIWWILEGQDYPRLWWQYCLAFSPYPQDGAVDVTQTPVLIWAPGLGASHEIYFGTDADAVKNADTSSPEYKGSKELGIESYEPGQLEWNTTYYWRIDEVNNSDPDSPWRGSLWSFTTANFLVVDDFESYSDISESFERNRIYEMWMDGFDNPATNGSQVGHLDPPFYEETIVHSGNKSMPLYYDNSGPANYSEATASIHDLYHYRDPKIGRDWTREGVEILSLWFHGDSNNSPEPMYVALNGSVVVYYDNPEALLIEDWTEWRIDLQVFADQGVDLTNIYWITIGFGDRDNPQPGGSGMVFFDDIRLYRSP